MAALELTAKRLGYMFYIASPNETSFQHIEDVPDYITQVRINCFSLSPSI